MLELTNLRTENGKLFEAWKDTKSGTPSYTLEARTGPIHYKSKWTTLHYHGAILRTGRALVF